jgi:hypothetical protein
LPSISINERGAVLEFIPWMSKLAERLMEPPPLLACVVGSMTIPGTVLSISDTVMAPAS